MTATFRFAPRAWALLVVTALCLAWPGWVRAGDDDVLRPVLDSYRKELATSHAGLNSLELRLMSEVDAMTKKAVLLGKKRDRLVLLFGSSLDPWDLRDVSRANDLLLTQANSLLTVPETLDTELRNSANALRDMEAKVESRLQETITPDVAQDLRDFLKELGALIDHIGLTREELSKGILPVRELKMNLQAEDEKIDKELLRIWTAYYTQQTPTLFDPQLAGRLAYAQEQWRSWFAFVGDVRRGELRGLSLANVYLASLAVAAAVALVCMLLNRRFGGASQPPEQRRTLRSACLCISASVGFSYLAWVASTVVYSIVLSISEVLLTAGLVFLSKFLGLLSRKHASATGAASRTATRWPLWALFAFGLILQTLRTPDIFMQPVFALLFCLLAWRIARQLPTLDAPVDKFITGLCALALPAFAALALAGFCRAAVLCTTALFYLVLCVRFSRALIGLLSAWQETMADKWSPLVIALIASVGFPLIFLCTFSLSLWLASSQFEGQQVFLDVLSFEARFDAFAISVGRLGGVVFGYFLLQSAVQATTAVLEAYGQAHDDVEPGTVQSLQTISRYAWWAVYILFALFVLGFSFTSLTVVAGGLSVGIGFGLQQIVNNFISGLILLFGRSMEVGDVLQIGETTGVVKRVNIRNTMVQTYDNATIFMPNSTLVTAQIINWSHRDRRVRRDVNVGVAYGTDRAKVRDLLIRAALSVSDVLKSPAPDVLFTDFGPSSLDFKLRVWIADVDTAASSLSRVREAVGNVLEDNGIEIAFPQSDVHLRSAPGLEQMARQYLTFASPGPDAQEAAAPKHGAPKAPDGFTPQD